MRIHYSPTSPYARKVRAAAIETGLHARIEWRATDPFADDAQLPAANPLGKVPVLVLDDGRALFDSRVICDYLVAIGTAPALLPAGADARAEAGTRLALADGVMDAAFATAMERRRPAQERSALWLGRWEAAIRRAVSAMELAPRPNDRFDLGDIATAVALDYLDLRLPGLGWRGWAPRLAAWQAEAARRPSLALTAPPKA